MAATVGLSHENYISYYLRIPRLWEFKKFAFNW